jgi:hypothetical protein
VNSDSKISIPKIVEQVLGIGVAQASCNYDFTILGCAEKLKSKQDSGIFIEWRSKLRKHEERMQIMATQDYRSYKRETAKLAKIS